MMRFSIHSILLVVFAVLFSSGLQAQQLRFDRGDVKAMPLPEWRPPTGQSATPLAPVSRTLQTQSKVISGAPLSAPLRSDVELSMTSVDLRSKRTGGSMPDYLVKDFSELQIVDIGEYGSPDGLLDFNPSVYFTVQIILRTSNGSLTGCTGILVDASTVITTGGCLYDEQLFGGIGGDGFAQSVFVFPGYDERIDEEILLEYNYTIAESIDVATAWVEDGDFEFNIGVIHLARPLGGLVAELETGGQNYMGYGTQSNGQFRTRDYRNDGYPIGEDFQPATQYTREGDFDDIGREVVSIDSPSPFGMQGSPAYTPSSGDNTVAGSILSNASADGGTDFVRFTGDKLDFFDEFRDENTPDVSDVQPVVDVLNFIPDQVNPGEEVGNDDDLYVVSVYNYSNEDYSGPLFFASYLLPEGGGVEDVIFLSENFFGLNDAQVGAMELARFNVSGLFVVPEDVTPGDYTIGFIISAEDGIQENNNTIFPGDEVPIQIGDGFVATLSVDPTAIDVDAAAGTTTFDVTANVSWSATTDADWVTLENANGDADATVTVNYDENTSTTDSRTATITISSFDGGVDPVTVILTQESLSNFVFVSPDTIRVSGDGGTSSFTIESDLLWSAQAEADWLAVNPESGFGNADVDIAIDPNLTIAERITTITVSTAEDASAEVVVIQEGGMAPAVIAVDPTAISVDAMAGEFVAQVTSNTDWTAAGDADWISFAPNTGSGNAAITIKYEMNMTTEGRQATVAFTTATGESASVVITQSGADATISVDPTMIEIGSAEGDATVTVTANESWTASADADWVAVVPDAGNGSGDVIITYLANDELEDRSATVTFTTTGGATATVAVTQAGRERVTVVDIVVNSDIHNTLEAAVIAAELADDLSGEGPFTVFAPTDEAFAALPEGTVEALLEDPTGDLAQILLYHVVSGQFLASDLMDGMEVETLNGATVMVSITDDGVFINNAQVTFADILTDNGVVHIINAVLLPPVNCNEEVEGGTVALEDGSTEITIEIDDEEDVLTFTSEGADEDANFAYVITDDQNNILALPPSNMADLNGAGVGICRVWGLSYTGNITAMMGDNAAEVDLSDECFDLSDNFITVTRIEPALPATVVDIIVNSDVHETLEAAVIAAELADDLSGEGPFTVFAPTDNAFGLLPSGVLETLLEDPTGDLAQILLYHVVSGQVLSTELMDGMEVETLNGATVTVSINDDGVFINDAQVVVADLLAQNGVVHVIDAVLLPPVNCDELVEGGTVALEDGSTELTIEIDDEEDVLTFTSEGADEDASFAYVITDDQNNILALPPSNMADLNGAGVGVCRIWGLSFTGNLLAMVGDNAAEVDLSDECFDLSDNFITVTRIEPALPATVVDIIVNSDVHTTLEAAVIAAELADDLSGEGPFTVFAPTDDAFDALPEGTVEALLEDPTGDLAQILLYHVVSGQVLSSELMDGMVVETLNGQSVTVTINDDGIFVNDAQVTVADILAENGVVHVIDAVLLPELEEELPATVVDIIVESEVHTTLEAAVIAAELADDLSGEGPFTVFAPTDDAFDALPEGTVEALLEDPTGDLAQILLYHVVSGSVLSTDLMDGMVVETLNGQSVTVTINDDGIFVNDAQVTVADILAENGVVHVIDAVLLPELEVNCDEEVEGGTVALEDGSTEITIEIDDEEDVLTFTSEGADEDANFAYVITDDQNNILALPPSNMADLNGAGVGICRVWGLSYTGNITAMMGDNAAEVDLSDECFDLSDNFITVTRVEPELPATVVDIIVNSDVHNTLEAAVIAAELADDLSGEGPFTVFAPTDDAFDALPEGTVEALLEDPTGDLAQILLYHVVSGSVLSTDLMDGMVVETLNGQSVTVTINDDGIFVNDAQVIVADLEAQNGVVHVIDAVLLPELEEELPETVFDIIQDSEVHETLEVGIIAAQLVDDLESEGPFTVFAPTDDAFDALPDGVLEALLADPRELGEILLYHVLSGQVLAADLMDGQTATTLLGEDITITINDDGVFVNDAQVTVTDLLAQNGVVHVIDAVLIPSEEVDCDEEVEGGTVALEDGSTEITIIVDDEEDVLTFTSEGADEDANFAYVITDDQNNILALPPSNMADLNGAGVGICRVWGLSYTGNITAMMGDNAAEVDLSDECFDLSDNFITVTRVEPELPATVVDIIVNSDVHNTLEAAVIAAELADDLSGEGPFTVFAPTDDAFDALPEGTVEALLEDPTGDLAQILLYHVVSGSVLSTDLMDGMVVETLNGQSVTVTINDDGIFVNDAQVIVADLEAQNGVVHVIDAVLLPEEEEETNTVFDIIANSDIHETLEAAIIAADLDEALQGDGPFTVFAPTDDAFDALPDGVLDALLEGPVGDLQNILLYHVLDGTRTADSFIDGQRVLTRQGQTVTVTINDDGVFINDAQVTVADIAADNGVVHVINAVLVPDDGPSDSFLEIRPPSRVVGAEAGEVIFVVFTNTTWSISGDDDWYEVFIRESSGTKFIKVIYDANEEGPARTAVLTINATTGESETFTLTQSGSDDFVAVTPETIDVSAVMGMTSFDVIASGDYSVDTDADWLTLSEDGNTVNIMYMSNSSFETRSATITVTSAGGATATVTVNQGASEDIDIFFELRPDNLTVSAEAGEAQFVVYTNAIWAISTDADWLEFFVDEGQGTGFIKVIYEANEGATRTATFDIVTSTGESGTFTLTQEGTGGEELPATVVDIIVDSEVHETLETAVIAAGLVDALSGEGPFTVFAPTDEAFAALPEGTVEALLEDPMGQLSQILTYHVVSGRVLSTDLMDGMVVETLNGQSVTVTINDDGVFINDAQVTVADLEAQNGVVHVINAVLIPEEDGGNEDGVAQLFASSNTSGTIGVYELGENGAVSMSTIDGAPMDADGIYYDTETDVLYQLSRTDNVVNAYSNVSSGTPELTATSTSDFSNGREIAISGNRLVVAQDANEGNGMQNRLVVYEFSPTAIELVASYDVTINLWGIHAVEDDLIAIVDNSSDVAIYGGFFDNEETSGTLNVSRLVTVEGLVRTHGVTYDADEDVMYLTDVGEASSDSDGAIIVIDDFSAVIDQEDDDDMDDDNLIDSDEQVRVAGSATLLGNPVDIAYDTENEVIYVAERANGGGRILGFAVPSESGNVEPIYSDDFAGASAVFFSGSMEERIIEPTTIDQRSAITVDLTLFPNPTSSTLNVQVEASEERRVDVQVIDYNGRILQVLAGQVLFSGQNNLQIDASNLANGMYYLRIIGQDVVQDARFMVTK